MIASREDCCPKQRIFSVNKRKHGEALWARDLRGDKRLGMMSLKIWMSCDEQRATTVVNPTIFTTA